MTSYSAADALPAKHSSYSARRPCSPPWGTTAEPESPCSKPTTGVVPPMKTRTEMILKRQNDESEHARRFISLTTNRRRDQEERIVPAFGTDGRDWWTSVVGWTKNPMEALSR
ncbi:unnamed protein product [Sphacelaria rigidula]